LSSSEAATRLLRDGPNLLPQPERRSLFAIVLKVLREPMLLLLLGATAVYLLLGNAREAMILAVSVLLVIALTIYQEQKSEHALQALRDLSSPRAKVLRDGKLCVVPAQDLVVGDTLVVAEGDRLPADAQVLEENDLHVDESLLTGESVPVRRCVAPPGSEDGLLHASTLVVRGRGLADVVATGTRTAVGQIGVALRTIQLEITPMQHELRRVVLLFAGLALVACVAVTSLYYVTRGGGLAALLAGLTLAIATIPEEFPVVLTVFLAMGAWRMAQHSALVRRMPAIEALGAATVLCTDKTGTLTENRMAVAELAIGGDHVGPEEAATPAMREIVEIAGLACPELTHDPMEHALQEAAARMRVAHSGWQHLREYPFSPECPAVAHAWSDPGETVVACKGAPETVADLCLLSAEQRAQALAEVDAMARRGLRVLAAASARWPGGAAEVATLPASMHELGLRWLGLIGFADPLRAGVPEAVAEAQAAGIRMIMLTGDHTETARAIAREAGIANHGHVALGRELDVLDALDDSAMPQLCARTSVFARVRPEHKLRLVQALKDNGEVVAMTGDGVNDAPALMAAHVGIAMGQRGTDVAREAAAIVLLDDNFVTVVRAVRLGRTIYDNIRRAMRYILAVHVPITGLAVLPLLTGGPLILLPLHVVFLELIIDPACSIVFEREPAAADIMQRPPRPPTQRLLGIGSLLGSLMQGAVMFAVVALVYAIGRADLLPAMQSGAAAFTALVTGNLGLILLYRSGTSPWHALHRHNAAFWVVVTSAVALLVAVTRFELPAGWFGFAPPPVGLWALALLLPPSVAVLLALLQSGGAFKFPSR
jgi:Ca2+-transporting ATPase